jgi:hypothetical protein
MKLLKKKRSILRTALSRGHSKLLERIHREFDESALKCELDQLNDKIEQLKKLDAEIFHKLLNEGVDDETLLKEVVMADEYSVRFELVHRKLNIILVSEPVISHFVSIMLPEITKNLKSNGLR